MIATGLVKMENISLSLQYNTIQYNTIQYNAMQCNAMRCDAMRYNTIQYNTIQYNIVYFQHRTQLHYKKKITQHWDGWKGGGQNRGPPPTFNIH